MKLATLSAVFALVIASSCANLESQREDDQSDLRTMLQERIGVEVRAEPSDDGSLVPEARDLLSNPLTEDTAVKVAVLNNRMVRAELAALGVASADLIQAGLLSNPVLSVNAKFFDGGTEIEGGIVASFFDIFFVSARKRVQAAELEATKARISREVVRLVHDVRRACVRVRAAERLVEVETEILRAAKASVDLMRELHKAGNVTDPLLTAEEVAHTRAQSESARADLGLLEARESLNVLLGLWGDSIAWTLDGALSDAVFDGLDLTHVETRAITASLDLSELRAKATASARRAGIVGWEAVLAPGEIGLASKREVGSPEWGLGPALGFSLPVFDFGGARRAAEAARLDEFLALHVAEAVEIRSAARRLRERIVALSTEASFMREQQLPKAKRFVLEMLRNYNAMQIGVFTVFAARQQEIDANRTYVETLRDAWLARLDLGELIAGSMNKNRIEWEPSAGARSGTSSRQGQH